MSEISEKCSNIWTETRKIKDNVLKGNTIMNIEGEYELPSIENLTPENIKHGVEINHIVGTYATKPKFISFADYTGTSIDLRGLDTSNMTKLDSMFQSCRNLETLDVSTFNTFNIVSMRSMFYECKKLSFLDLSNFDTSNVTDMYQMFRGFGQSVNASTKVVVKGLNSFNTSKITSLENMFMEACIDTIDVHSWDTSNVTNFLDVFYANGGGSRVATTSINVSGWDTSKGSNMFGMFYNQNKLTSLDLSSFTSENLRYVTAMFEGCTSLKTLDISGMEFSKVTEHNSTFKGVPTNCTIYVKNQTVKDLLTSWDSTHTYTIKS